MIHSNPLRLGIIQYIYLLKFCYQHQQTHLFKVVLNIRMSMGTRKACLPLQSWASASYRGWCQGHTSAWSKNGVPGKSATSIIFIMYLTYGMILAFSRHWTSKSRNIFFPFFIPYLNPTLTKVHLMLIHLELNLKLNLSNNICLRMFFFIKPLVNGSPRSVDLFHPSDPSSQHTLWGEVQLLSGA